MFTGECGCAFLSMCPCLGERGLGVSVGARVCVHKWASSADRSLACSVCPAPMAPSALVAASGPWCFCLAGPQRDQTPFKPAALLATAHSVGFLMPTVAMETKVGLFLSATGSLG